MKFETFEAWREKQGWLVYQPLAPFGEVAGNKVVYLTPAGYLVAVYVKNGIVGQVFQTRS